MPKVSPSRYLVQAGWDDVPHLTDQTKRELLDATQPFQREARSKGVPALGIGAIYPIPWEEVICEPFQIPAFWRRAYGMDVGWNRTACIWLAHDEASDVLYAHAEYYGGQKLPAVHAIAIKARGSWIRGAIDPASRGRSQIDGKKLITQYRAAGLNLKIANNAVDYGIQQVWERLETGRLKFFRTMPSAQFEYMKYRREEKVTDVSKTVKIVKKDDHLMDALRYGVVEFENIARVKPIDRNEFGQGWQPANNRTGY